MIIDRFQLLMNQRENNSSELASENLTPKIF